MIRLSRTAVILVLVVSSSLIAGYGEEANISGQEIAQKTEESFKSQYLKTRVGDQPVYHFSFYLRCADLLIEEGKYEAAEMELEKVRRYYPMDYWAQSLYCSWLLQLLNSLYIFSACLRSCAI